MARRPPAGEAVLAGFHEPAGSAGRGSRRSSRRPPPRIRRTSGSPRCRCSRPPVRHRARRARLGRGRRARRMGRRTRPRDWPDRATRVRVGLAASDGAGRSSPDPTTPTAWTCPGRCRSLRRAGPRWRRVGGGGGDLPARSLEVASRSEGSTGPRNGPPTGPADLVREPPRGVQSVASRKPDWTGEAGARPALTRNRKPRPSASASRDT